MFFLFFSRVNQISSEGCQERICQLSSIMEQPERLLSPPASSCIIHCQRLKQRHREWGEWGLIGVLCDYLEGAGGGGGSRTAWVVPFGGIVGWNPFVPLVLEGIRENKQPQNEEKLPNPLTDLSEGPNLWLIHLHQDSGGKGIFPGIFPRAPRFGVDLGLRTTEQLSGDISVLLRWHRAELLAAPPLESLLVSRVPGMFLISTLLG